MKNNNTTNCKGISISTVNTVFLLLVITSLLTSCGNLKQLQYLQGPIDTAALSKINYVEPVIQKGDILSITVYSDNQLASSLFNQGGATTSTTASAGVASPTTTTPQGYLVSQQGNIQLYALGLLKVEGLTKKQLSDLMVEQYVQQNLLKNPYVEIRFLNFKVTVVGDVGGPGVFTFATEKVSIFDAIGLAGDLTVYAKRDNVLVIRETNGSRTFQRLDLTNPNVFNSPYYYLQQNDLVIVDPTKVKATTTDQTFRNISIATSILSIVGFLYSILSR